MNLFILIISAIFVNNFVLVKFMGICPFLGVSKKTESALGMGVAVVFVMTIASVVTYAIHKWLLIPFEMEFLQTIVFIFVIAALVQIVEMVIKKISPSLYRALGVYLPLITTNCAILGVAILNFDVTAQIDTIFLAAANGFFGGVGFTVAILLLSGLREKLDRLQVPKAFRGFPMTLITAGFMAMAFAIFTFVQL